MHSHPIFSRLRNLKPTLVAAVLLAAFFGVCAVGIASSTAQSPQKEERELDDKIPKHLPIKIRVKNLNNEKWAQDVAVEVTNTGDKAIYYLGFTVVLPDVLTENNHKLGFSMQYGRGDLIDYNAPLRPDDVPIKPGETYTFKIPERQQQNWEHFVKRRGVPKHAPKKFRLVFKSLNFGDGTGFGTIDGLPVDIHQKQAGGSCVRDKTKLEKVAVALNKPPNRSPDSSSQPSTLFLPASFVPVKLFIANASTPASSTSLTRPDVCCPGTICSRLKLRKVNCCGEIDKAFSAACNEGGSFCAIVGDTTDIFCSVGGGTYCEEDSLVPLCSAPTPTPTPISTPTPTPTPECDERTRPNDTNCYCETNFPPFPFWNCLCLDGGDPANYQIADNVNGCPSGTYNNGRDCCFPIAPTPTPTPTPVGGGCTTPGWNGRCPYGTYPDNGRCCPGGAGGCNGVAAAGAGTAGLSADSPDSSPSLAPGGGLSCNSEWSWDGCQCVPSSPIVMDIAGDGFRLTDAAGGVSFDLNSDDVAERLSWTSTNSDDAWLALDRDANATIDDGRELFGNFTPQPAPPAGQERNGFRALAVYDWTTNGGNGDGVIDARDPVFSRLRVWQDINHNGVSEAGELRPLPSLQVVRLHLAYKESKRVDEHGNAFRYRAKLNDAKGAKAGGWAWDVFLVAAAR